MSADRCEALDRISVRAYAELMEAMEAPEDMQTVERSFMALAPVPVPAPLPVTHLMLGRSEPVRLPSGALACWDDPAPSLRRPMPITITVRPGPTEVMLFDLGQMLHEFNREMQDRVYQTLAVPASMMRERERYRGYL